MSRLAPVLTENQRTWIAFGAMALTFSFGMFVVLFVH